MSPASVLIRFSLEKNYQLSFINYQLKLASSPFLIPEVDVCRSRTLDKDIVRVIDCVTATNG